jgi:hypothetical protein
MKFLTLLCITLGLLSFSSGQSGSYIDLFGEPQTVEIKATLNKSKCNNKAFIPVELPEKAKGIIYSIKAVPKAAFKATEASLLEEVKALSTKHEYSKVADYLLPGGTQKSFNFYLINGKENIESFNNCGHYYYNQKFIHTKSRTGYLDCSQFGEDTLYIGIENANDLQNLRLIVEVVAVVEK